jgi:CheY-like chemotaxis protein
LVKRKATQQFLAAVSFDFRTPLNVILGVGKMLCEDRAADPALTVQAAKMLSAAHVLSVLLSEMQFADESSSSRSAATPSDFSLADRLTDTRWMLDVYASAKGLQLHLSISSDIPSCIHGDEQALQLLLTNRVLHAIRHSDHGTVTIAVDVVTNVDASCISAAAVAPVLVDGERIFVRFTITGTGPSPAPVSAPSRADSVTGSLAIDDFSVNTAHCVVRHLGGRMTACRPGAGAASCCVVPLYAARPALPEFSPSAEWPASLRVLVVDNSAEMQYVLGRYLMGTPHSVRIASTGGQAAELLFQMDFDVVLLDLYLPTRLSGLDLVRTIRDRSDRHAPTSIIVVSASIAGVDRDVALQAGATAFETKPLGRDRVLALLRAVALRLASGPQPVTESHRASATRLCSAVLEQHAISAVLGKSAPIMRPAQDTDCIVRVPLSMLSYLEATYLADVRSEVVVMIAAQLEHNVQRVRKVASKIASSATSFGLVPLAQAARCVEIACGSAGDAAQELEALVAVVRGVRLLPLDS